MFKKILISLKTGLLLMAVFSCDDSSAGQVVPAVAFADYVHFDTSALYVMKVSSGDSSTFPEIYLWWERSFGESFIDLNENGEYDQGIDLFIMTVDEDNMDLNHDGRWNGPDEPWEPGFPFDDIDGDDNCRSDSYYSDARFQPGVPFYDANGNDAWDSLLNYECDFVRIEKMKITDSSMIWCFDFVDTVLQYVSDFGVNYKPVLDHPYCNVCKDNWKSFEVTNRGLYFQHWELIIPLLDGRTIYNDTGTVSIYNHDHDGADVICFRSITIDQPLTIDGVLYTELLKIRCDQFHCLVGGDTEGTYAGSFWEFYFCHDSGLLAVYCKPTSIAPESWHYFQPLKDQPPVLLTK